MAAQKRTRSTGSTIGLVHGLQQGDAVDREEMWRRLIDKVEDRVRAVLVKQGVPSHLLDEVVVAVTEKVWAGLPDYQPQARVSFWSWVTRIAKNAWLDVARKLKRDRRNQRLSSGDSTSGSGIVVADSGASPPSQAGRARELIALIERVLDGVSATKSDAWRLRKFEQLDYEEIAARLKMQVPSVRSIVCRLDQEMRAKLSEKGYGDEAVASDAG
ncbi:MAG: sigma-70 family RNA polymerase sigma factor [Planctomycetes bacterium]|nr:sigma-70 family RNA polymerase sigma factor [Planctomycetota bacterium]